MAEINKDFPSGRQNGLSQKLRPSFESGKALARIAGRLALLAPLKIEACLRQLSMVDFPMCQQHFVRSCLLL
jgi:hypothetical protein